MSRSTDFCTGSISIDQITFFHSLFHSLFSSFPFPSVPHPLLIFSRHRLVVGQEFLAVCFVEHPLLTEVSSIHIYINIYIPMRSHSRVAEMPYWHVNSENYEEGRSSLRRVRFPNNAGAEFNEIIQFMCCIYIII